MNLGTIDKRIFIALVLILFCADYLWDLTSYFPPDRIQGILGKARRVVSYGAGLTMMSLKAFSLATFLGMLAITFAYNYFGSAILAANRGMVQLLGLLLVSFLFWFPRLVERYDVFFTAHLIATRGGRGRTPKPKGVLDL